jgi:hypothetical protein
MVPGMDHCGGGTGPNQFNKLAALERWREQNEPPKSITVRVNESGVIDMTRPLCPYPQRAVYKGSGSTNDAANYTCRVKGNLTTADSIDSIKRVFPATRECSISNANRKPNNIQLLSLASLCASFVRAPRFSDLRRNGFAGSAKARIQHVALSVF